MAPFKYLVRLMEENRVSAIPIVDQKGIPIGIVSESDLTRLTGELDGVVGVVDHLTHKRDDTAAGPPPPAPRQRGSKTI
jgi:CBS domain-containing protein